MVQATFEKMMLIAKTQAPPSSGLPGARVGSRPIEIVTSDGLSNLLFLALKRPNHLSTRILVPAHTFKSDENT